MSLFNFLHVFEKKILDFTLYDAAYVLTWFIIGSFVRDFVQYVKAVMADWIHNVRWRRR